MRLDTQGFYGPFRRDSRQSTNVVDRRGIWDDESFAVVLSDWRDAARVPLASQRLSLFQVFLDDRQPALGMLEAHIRAVLGVMRGVYQRYGVLAPNARPIEFRYVATDLVRRVEIKNTSTGTVFYVAIGKIGELGAIERSPSGWHCEARVP